MSENPQVTTGLIETQRLVDEIRVYLQSIDRTDSPRLRALAEQYALACVEVNDRLSRCFSFLRQGLRAEAIHLADTPPPVMELLSILEFAERNEWEELATDQRDWPRAPALAVDSAQALNEAYAQEDPLRDVIRNHRLLALSRAPLAERLATLRKLAELDPNNPNWQDDLRTFEKARLTQLDDDIKHAAQELDLPALTAIESELAQPGWVEQPTETQRSAVKAAADELRRSAARSSLAELSRRLFEAWANSDVETARRLRNRWTERAKEAALDRKHPLHVKMAPVLEWLEQEDFAEAGEASYQELLSDIEEALAQGAGRSELERLERIVAEMNRPLPAELDKALADRYLQFDRRNRAILIGAASSVVLLVLCCVALVFWFHVDGQRRLAIERGVAQIESLLKRGQTKDARQVYEKLVSFYPAASYSPAVDTALQKIGAAEAENEQRGLRFREVLRDAKAEATLTEESPQIRGLRQLARTPEEEAALDKLLDDVRARAQRVQASSQAEIENLMEKLRPEIGTLEGLVASDALASETGDKIKAIRDEVSRLKSLAPQAGPTCREEAKNLAARYEELSSSRSARIRQAELERLATAELREDMSSREVDRFVKLCNDYAKEFPKTPRARDFAETVKEAELWKAILAWNQLIAEWGGTLFIDKVAKARERLDQVRKLRKEYSRFPNDAVIKDYERYLGTVVKALDPDVSAPLQTLFRVFNDSQVAKVYTLPTIQGKHYYSRDQPVKKGVGYHYTPIGGSSQGGTRTLLGMALMPGYPRLSAQSRIAEEAQRLLEKMEATPDSWDRAMATILRRIRSDEEIDPVLQMTLLAVVMKEAGNGSYGLQVCLADQVKAIEEAGLSRNVRWMDPDDVEAKVVRISARSLVSKLSLLKTLEEDAKKIRQQLSSQVFKVYRPAGWLSLDDAGEWRKAGTLKVQPGAELWIAMPSLSWERAGKYSPPNRVDTISAHNRSSVLREGRLVFVLLQAR